MAATDPRRTIDAVFRIESPKLIASLARMTGDIGLAEDFAQDALVAALQQWPESGVPDSPGAWLMTTAKRRAVDNFRRTRLAERKREQIGVERLGDPAQTAFDDAMESQIDDDLLRLVFVCCHPVLPVPARVALTLRLLCGLTTREIARAHLVTEPAVAQRIVRAKRTLAEAGVPFEVPEAAEFAGRMDSVLQVIYLVFNEGYSATAGEDWFRPRLCEDAQRLGRVLAELAPDEPEVHGLVALMEIQASRLRARLDAYGKPVRLADQDRTRWDRLLIGRGLAALGRARKLGGPMGPYVLQAAIAACHAVAPTVQQTDWERIAALYERLGQLTPSPVVDLNRAVAVSMARGAGEGLELVDRLLEEPAIRDYHLLYSVRGDLLERLARHREARDEFARAAALTGNAAERELLLLRVRNCEENAANNRKGITS